jgi:Icc protein
MPRAVWLSDLHLDFVSPDEALACWHAVAELKPDWVMLGGDIGQAENVVPLLRQAAAVLDRPVAFVLGNHDYYRGSIAEVRAEVREVCRQEPRLKYLSGLPPIALTDRVALVGHDGWGDARAGDYATSDVVLNDYYLIEELANLDSCERRLRLNALGDEAAAHARRVLPQALEAFEEVIFLTHVPPFREACWHEGRLSDDNWAPHFCCLALGDALVEVMQSYPHRRLTVLCGHTHGRGEAQLMPQLRVLTAGAIYGQPGVERVLELG